MNKLVLIKKNSTLPILSDKEGFSPYMRFVNLIPILTEKQEKELTRRLHYQQDMEAAQQLIMSHLRFVVKLARKLSGYGLPITDLIQEGNIGLMKAIKRFNPNIGVRLVSFAIHWIKAEMHEYILKNWRIVKIATTKSHRKLFFNLRKNKNNLIAFSKNEVEDVAKALNIKPSTVIEMEKRMEAYDMTLDTPKEEQYKDNNYPNLYNALNDLSKNPETINENKNLKFNMYHKINNAIQRLDNRSKDIIISRWFSEKKISLKHLAIKYNISAERIRQIEAMSIEKLKTCIKRIN